MTYTRLGVWFLAIGSLVGCATATVKPQAPGFDDTDSYRKKIEVRVIGCQIAPNSKDKNHRITIVEDTKNGIRFQLDGCYGDAGEVFQIIR